ncbi:hypothetical protein AA313_de0200842 [Arthrobotrys entomopaga]|nr:hypothetical protein AA313_de0200842 [Arthrobotrys entomopaga]
MASILISTQTSKSSLRAVLGLTIFCILIAFYTPFFTPQYFPYIQADEYPQLPTGQGVRIHRIIHDKTFEWTTICLPSYDPLSPPSKNLTLILTLTNDTASWGQMTEPEPKQWTFSDFIDRIRSQNVPAENLHLGLLTGDRGAYESYLQTLSSLPTEETPWAKAEILYLETLPYHLPDNTPTLTRQQRHNKAIQLTRRMYLARLRNFLSAQTLTPEIEHVIWLDADVYEYPNGMIQRFWELANIPTEQDITGIVKAGLRDTRAPPIGLITMLSSMRTFKDYDRNAWSGFGKRPPNVHIEEALKGKQFPGMEEWAKSVGLLIVGTNDDDIVKLDSVGGTVLYIKAELLREGLIWTPYPVVGTRWGSNGSDGIESEGLCYIAERLGWGCYALGGSWKTRHSDD